MKRFKIAIAALPLCASLAALTTASFAAPNAPVPPEERAKIEEVVHQYLLQKPEVILEAMQVLQRKQYEDAQQTVKQTQKNVAQYAGPLFHQNDDPVAGNPNGKVTVVEFFDYQCPHCVDMAPVIDAIIKANPNVRVVFKEFPIRGPMSDFAARAALAANKQGKYVDFSHKLLTSTQPLTQDTVYQLAKNSGLNVDQLKKDMNDPAIDKQLKETHHLASNLKLFGTPAFFIGKTEAKNSAGINYVPGQMNQAQLQDAIDKASN